MSRIGRMPVEVPSGVSITIGDDSVTVKGPKGELKQAMVDHVSIKVEDGQAVVSRDNELKQAKSNHGLMRSLLSNMVQGVHSGFTKELQILGVGYRADVKGKNLVLNLGYSHLIEFPIPAGIDITVDKSNKISVSGADKQQVGQVSAVIRGYRKPDNYKGKGVRYVDEYVRIKAGKSA